MIVRYPLACDGCGRTTVLRIGVSHREREPFHFQCRDCSQRISGVHLTDQKTGRVLGIEDLLGAHEADNEGANALFHLYHPDFATDVDQNDILGASPFLDATMRLGDEFHERMHLIATFYDSIPKDSRAVQRIAAAFFEERWDHFAKGITEYFQGMPVENYLDRQRALFQLVEIFFGPLLTSEGHTTLINSMHENLLRLAQSKPPLFEAFLDEVLDSNYVTESRRELIEILLRFPDVADSFRGMLPYWNLGEPNPTFPADLEIKGPLDFHQLKSLYVDGYEAIARALTVVVALANLENRADHRTYPPHPTLGKKFDPKSLADFHSKSNAPKLGYLRELPWLDPWLLPALDPKLRNAIGHNSAKFNPTTGAIEYQLDKSGTVQTISYGEFLSAALRVVRAALQLAHMMKQLVIVDQFRKGNTGT